MGTGLPHDVGNSEAAPDLDQLAARNDDLLPRRQGREHEQERRRIVVDDERGLGPSQAPQLAGRMGRPAPPVTGDKVVIQIAISGRDCGDACDGRGRQRRPTEIGVNDDAGRVDDRPERWRQRAVEDRFRSGLDGPGGVFALAHVGRSEGESGPKRFGCIAQGRDNRLMPISVFEFTHGITLPELIDRRNHSKLAHRFRALPASSVQDTITLTFL